MKILITGVGGPTPRSFAIALKKYGKLGPVELIGTDSNPLSIGLYQNELFTASFVVPSASDPEYWNRMEEIIAANAIDVAVILPEQEVMERSRRKKSGTLPCKTLVPDLAIAEVLVDKARMTRFLDRAGAASAGGAGRPVAVGPVDPLLAAGAILLASAPMLSIYPIFGQRHGKEGFCAATLLVATVAAFVTIATVIWLLHASGMVAAVR